MDTTESSNQGMTLESAADMLVEQDQPEVTEEVTEDEVEQPEMDSTDDSEDSDDAEVEDVDPDEVEETEDEDDEDYEDVEEDAEDSDPDEDFHIVKIDGEEKRVSLEELKRGYSGQQYVQKGMQQAAEARKQAEGVYQALMQERQNLAQLVQQAQVGGLAPPQEPSRELFNADPIGYMEAKMQYEDNLKAYNEQQQKLSAVMQQQTQAEQEARSQYAHQEAQKLVEIVPELRDAKKASVFKEKVVRTATEVYGYTPEEIANISSHRDFLVLRDAMRYRESIKNGDVVREKAKKARPVIKPGAKKVSTTSDAVRKQRDRLKKTGSLDAALSLILET